MSVALDGERISGHAVREKNVMASLAVANVVKSSLGPVGLDKMLVDDVGDVTITNDGATILKLLEVDHPAAKILCELATLQDQEIGDGTTSVVIIAAELLKNANELAKNGLHPTTIIAGYRIACREACRYISEVLSSPVTDLGENLLLNVAMTSMSSKIIFGEKEFFAKILVDAVNAVKKVGVQGNPNKVKVPVNGINILKNHGGKMTDSIFIKGYALNCTVACEAMPKSISNAKIAFLDFGLLKAKMALGVHVLVTDPTKLEAIRNQELEIVLNKIRMIISAGANVILTTGGIDDMCLKPLVENNVMGVRRVKKTDLRRIAEATGGTVCLSLANMEGDESFETSFLGSAESITQTKICDNEYIQIIGPKSKRGASIVLRGGNDFLCEEMERSVHDALCVIKRVVESDTVVPGGAAVETALSIHLENFASTIETKEQLAVASFADSLLVIPRTLALNSTFDATELTAALRSIHYQSQSDPKKASFSNYGLDLNDGTINDKLATGVIEPAISKIKMLKFATEAAITILRIDDMVVLAPERKEQNDDECQ